MRGKITKRTVDALAQSETGDAILWDTEVRGFGVRIQRGATRSYILALLA